MITVKVQIHDDDSGRDINIELDDILISTTNHTVDRYTNVRNMVYKIADKVTRAYKEAIE